MDWNGIKTHIGEQLRRAPVEYIEVRLEESNATSFRFRGPTLESIEEGIRLGGCVRALSRSGWGFAAFNDLSDLDARIAEATQLAQLADSYRTRPVTLVPVPQVSAIVRPQLTLDPRTVSLEDKLRRFRTYNEQIMEFGDPITNSQVVYFDRQTRIVFLNNEGTSVDQLKTDVAGSLVAIATRDNDTQMGNVPFGSNNDYGVTADLGDAVQEACQTAALLLDAPTVSAGPYTVVAAPSMAGVFIHEAFGHLSEADDLMDNDRMREVMKLGRRFGPEILSIFDSGDTSGSRGYLAYDDEGVVATRADLIREGVLVGRLHSRQSSATMGEDPTGNARALDHRFAPICRMRNTQIAPGEATFEDMIRDVKRGLYVVTPYGGQTDDEMFTFMAGKSYLIEDGQIGPMVRDITLSGNVFHTLVGIDRVGRDVGREESPGGCGKGAQSPLPVGNWSPHIRIQNVVVGGQSQ